MVGTYIGFASDDIQTSTKDLVVGQRLGKVFRVDDWALICQLTGFSNISGEYDEGAI